VDASDPPERALADLDAIADELLLFSASLARKKRVAVLAKLDVTEARENAESLRAGLEERGYDVVGISSVSGEGLRELLGCIARALEEIPRDEGSSEMSGGEGERP
jgi:GTP-binding protein